MSSAVGELTSATKHGAACITCRRRARRCDRTLPFCRACASRGICCEGYLLRWSRSDTSRPSHKRNVDVSLASTRKTKLETPGTRIFVSREANSDDSIEPALADSADHEIDSAAAIAALSDTTSEYDVGPASVPDGLGHLVNYGVYKDW